MSRRDLSEADKQAHAMGLMTIDQLAGTDPRDLRFAQDMEALGRSIFDLPPLGGREEIKDPLADDPTHIEHYGKHTGPSFAELSQRWSEWEDLARRASYAEPEPVSSARHPQADEGDNAVAERLWAGFRTSYPALAKDEAAVEQAAEIVMQRGGFQTEQQFIDMVAAELDGDE